MADTEVRPRGLLSIDARVVGGCSGDIWPQQAGEGRVRPEVRSRIDRSSSIRASSSVEDILHPSFGDTKARMKRKGRMMLIQMSLAIE